MTEDEPFGRQPKPVHVRLSGSREDILYWHRELKRRAEFKGDVTQDITVKSMNEIGFTIFPRAVND